MATDLRRIPGAGPPPRGPRRRRRAPATPLIDPRHRQRSRFRTLVDSIRLRPPRRPHNREPRKIPWSSIAIALGFVVLGAFVWSKFWDATRVDVAITGLEPGAILTQAKADELDVRIDVAQMDLEAGLVPTLFFDGIPANPEHYEIEEDAIRWTPRDLDEGEHVLAMSIGRPLLDEATFRWSFVIDATPPQIEIVSPQPAAPVCQPVSVTGRAEAGLEAFTVNGEPMDDIADDGTFRLEFDQPPPGPVLLYAVDKAGNEAFAEIVIPVAYPSTQGIHVTAAAWGYRPLREHVLSLVDAGKVSAVQLDIKDEGGIVGYDTEVALAHEIGAVRVEYDLEEAIDLLHDKGVRVIGRVVAFRDAPLTNWAVQNGRMDYVIQDGQGKVLSKYGGFTNVANPIVRQYNIDLALEALEAGADEILWDYVRRPEGSLDRMELPGLQPGPGQPEASAINDAVVGFLAEAAIPIRERCAYQGASLFGIAARNPDAIGQPVPGIARHVDYIAPMLYPSHWVRGEYRVDHPNAQPYDIVAKSLADFQRKAAGSGVAFNLWVQDFSIGVPYGPAEVRAQIDAAADLGVENWLLWNATVRYTGDAITNDIVHRPDGSDRPDS